MSESGSTVRRTKVALLIEGCVEPFFSMKPVFTTIHIEPWKTTPTSWNAVPSCHADTANELPSWCSAQPIGDQKGVVMCGRWLKAGISQTA